MQVVEEIETAEAGETNRDIEVFVDASSVKQEGQQEEDKYSDPIEDTVEENKVEDTFSTEVVKGDDDNKVKESERGIEVASKAEEDQPQALQKEEQGEKLENLLEPEPSRENAKNVTTREGEGTIQNLEETTETEQKGDKAKNLDGTNDSEKEV